MSSAQVGSVGAGTGEMRFGELRQPWLGAVRKAEARRGVSGSAETRQVMPGAAWQGLAGRGWICLGEARQALRGSLCRAAVSLAVSWRASPSRGGLRRDEIRQAGYSAFRPGVHLCGWSCLAEVRQAGRGRHRHSLLSLGRVWRVELWQASCAEAWMGRLRWVKPRRGVVGQFCPVDAGFGEVGRDLSGIGALWQPSLAMPLPVRLRRVESRFASAGWVWLAPPSPAGASCALSGYASPASTGSGGLSSVTAGPGWSCSGTSCLGVRVAGRHRGSSPRHPPTTPCGRPLTHQRFQVQQQKR